VSYDLVVIGGSWGGMRAVQSVLAGLGEEDSAAIVVGLHRGASESHRLARLLQHYSKLPIRDVEDKDDLLAGNVYLAPPDYHTLIETKGTIGLSTEAAVSFARPSIDVLFRTAAEAYRERCIGVLLTGANDDGADGLRRIKDLGGAAVVQDPDTAERPEMPRAAIAATSPDAVLPLEEIGGYVRSLLLQSHAANRA
jgi:two-component system chemotaxis response regulator CheB